MVYFYRDIAEVLRVKFYLNIDQRYRDNSFARILVTRGHPCITRGQAVAGYTDFNNRFIHFAVAELLSHQLMYTLS